MRINNIGEFKTFLIENQLDNLDSTTADFVACVLQYSVICSCKKSQKHQKGEECTRQYINIVNTVLKNYKTQIFEKISESSLEFFYNNSFFIGSLSK